MRKSSAPLVPQQSPSNGNGDASCKDGNPIVNFVIGA
jgi:hypothetical protein